MLVSCRPRQSPEGADDSKVSFRLVERNRDLCQLKYDLSDMAHDPRLNLDQEVLSALEVVYSYRPVVDYAVNL